MKNSQYIFAILFCATVVIVADAKRQQFETSGKQLEGDFEFADEVGNFYFKKDVWFRELIQFAFFKHSLFRIENWNAKLQC